jgi:hypothetical protein
MKNRARLAYREIVPARRPIVQPKLLPIGRFISRDEVAAA